MKWWSLLIFALGLVGLSAQPTPEVSAIIAKARAHLGEEALLQGVNAIRMVGRLEIQEGAAPVELAKIELVYQKPSQHLMVIEIGGRVEATGLDATTGWIRSEIPGNAASYRMTPLGFSAMKSLRMTTWENLYFFLSPGVERAEWVGEEILDGLSCDKVVFHYDRGVSYTRWFSRETGAVVRSQNPQGALIEESGVLESGGIRFPAKTVSRLALEGGQFRVVTMRLDFVEVNRPLAGSVFEQPLPRPVRR